MNNPAHSIAVLNCGGNANRPEPNRTVPCSGKAPLDNPPGFPYTPPGVDVLEGGKLTSNNVAGSSHDPLQSPAVASGAVSKPGGDAAGQDALHMYVHNSSQVM